MRTDKLAIAYQTAFHLAVILIRARRWLATQYEAMDPADARHAGLAYALKMLAQSYAEHPDYRPEWRP
ncbi:hypothetical protein G3I47_24890 [Streptomyces anulatus]|nr:hypothetical protein [Streptomyces anulatus]